MGAETALGMQGFGVGMSTAGAFYTAQGQQSTLSAQAHIDENNAKMATMSAQSALLTGQREEQAKRLTTAQLKSTQRAAIAANGIDLGSQSPVAVLTSTDVVGEVDANEIAANAMRKAFGYQTQSVNYSNRARGARAAADGINPIASAGGTLLTGAGAVASSWYKLDKAGAFSSTDDGPNSSPPQDSWIDRNFGDTLVARALY